MKKLRYGVIGCGSMGREHIAAHLSIDTGRPVPMAEVLPARW